MSESTLITTKPGMRSALWMGAGAALLLAVMLLVLHFQKNQNPAEQLALHARRLELVNQIRLNLASAAEAEKSAVMAVTDEDSQTFAGQARAATAAADQARRALESLLQPDEREGFSQFSQNFVELQRIDKEVLDLAVKNTNLKASALAFGPAATAIKEMDAGLARLPADDVKVVRLIDDARIAALRLQALLPPHIAEESDQKMDAMEAEMAREDQDVRRSLDALSAVPSLAGNSDLKTATASYAQFSGLRVQILKLSRENTNVRSLTLSLTQKRKATSLCQDALASLQQVIQKETVGSALPGKAVLPR